MRRKLRLKRKYAKLLYFILILLFFCIFTIAVSKIIFWQLENNKIEEEVKSINNISKIKDITDNKNTQIIAQEEQPEESNPYWDYIKMNLIDVNFTELKNTNNETVGWIQVNGTNINYPFVQTKDNDFYLNHSYNKKSNSAGWVFLDYRNNINTLDKNTIIYAHGRLDKSMFGSLKNILSSGWLNNTNNYVIKLSTETENTLWQVFSTYHIPTTNDYLKINFNNDEEFLNFTNKLINRSAHNFNANIYKNDKILTLSTCYNNKEKVVLHAKLIKKETKTNK